MALEILDRVPTKPGRVLITPEDGSSPFYAVMSRADEPEQEGTPINKELLDNMTKATNVGVSTEVQELLGANNVDDGLKNVPNLLSDYAKIQLIREFTVNSTSGGSGSLGTVASETDFSKFDCFIVKLENFTISLKAQSKNNWASIILYLRPLNGDSIINDTYIYLGSVDSLQTATTKTLDLSGKTGFFIATFSKKLTFSDGNSSTSYGLAINGGNSEPSYSNNPVVGLYATIEYASSPIVKGNVKVYGLKYKL